MVDILPAAEAVPGAEETGDGDRWRIVERGEITPEIGGGGGDRDGDSDDEEGDEVPCHHCLFAYPAECNLSGRGLHSTIFQLNLSHFSHCSTPSVSHNKSFG